MSLRPIPPRSFTAADQAAFAALSGDRNPMHMDALASRRTQAGERVVHGVHALLWVLDSLAAHGRDLAALRHLKVGFTRFMFLGHPLRIVPDAEGATVMCDDLPVMSVALRFGDRPSQAALPRGRDIAATAEPAEVPIGAMGALAGWLASPVPAQALADAFPHAAACLHPRRLLGLAQCSRLVGMVCPGLHSMFATLALDLTGEVGAEDGIGFATRRVNPRMRLVDLAVAGSGLSGQVSAFVRHAPVGMPGMAAVMAHVGADEFAGSVALVVGGSRGLGALTAKIVAAGGGRVIATYARGSGDAAALQAEIAAARGPLTCRIAALDVTRPVAAQLDPIGPGVTSLFHFATPAIFRQKAGIFAPELFALFCRFYVGAFHELCTALMRQTDALAAFYPSSVAIEQRPKGVTEYSMAKAAGEMLCADLMQGQPGLRILASRLPRILTDQTATVAHAASADPLATMLPLVRATITPGRAAGDRAPGSAGPLPG